MLQKRLRPIEVKLFEMTSLSLKGKDVKRISIEGRESYYYYCWPSFYIGQNQLICSLFSIAKVSIE